MKKIKFSTLSAKVLDSETSDVDYLKILAEFVKAEFSVEASIEDLSAETINDFYELKEVMQKSDADVMALDPPLSDLLMANFPQIPSEVRESGFADSMLRQEKKLWPRNLISMALNELVIETSPKLDTHAKAYVTGSNALTQMCMALAIRLGYQKIVLVSENFAEAKMRAENVSKLFFGIDIQVLEDGELILQPNNGTILFNCISQQAQPDLFNDLTYLNFLSKNGLVIDLPFSFEDNELMKEAKHVGIQTLSGIKVLAKRDHTILNYFKLTDLDFQAYFERWTYNLKLALAELQNKTIAQ